jgi:hypothetical protein
MPHPSKRGLGILVCKQQKKEDPETRFFHEMATLGQKMGITVSVFNPLSIQWRERSVLGYSLRSQRWTSQRMPLPTLLYDRCLYDIQHPYAHYRPIIERLRRDPGVRFLGKALAGKNRTYQILAKESALRPYLPETIPLRSVETLWTELLRQRSLLLKPNTGQGGKGVISLILSPGEPIQVRGRTLENDPLQHSFTRKEPFDQWIRSLMTQQRYLIQPLLSLRTPQQEPFDLRILLQKNEKQTWEETGRALRIGAPHTLTSNLQGGGRAAPFALLKEWYPPKNWIPLINKIDHICDMIPKALERNQSPLCELGMDIGIDERGNPWVLEINSKPGRSLFAQLHHDPISKRAMHLPIRYASARIADSLMRAPYDKSHLGGYVCDP